MNKIDQQLCKKCMLCTEVCPCNVIGVNEQEELYFIPEREKICQECGQCMAVCKNKAVTVNGFSYTSDFRELPARSLQYVDYMDFLSSRRSVRNFKQKAVPDDMIEKLLESVCYAPYGAEPQKMCITVINSRERIQLALPHMEQFLNDVVGWMENPVARYMIKRKRNPETYNTLRNHLYPISKLGNYRLELGDRITRGAHALLIFHAAEEAEAHTHNAMIYATYAMLTAHALGLGASMNGIVAPAINKNKRVREVFDIPASHEAVISLMLGYPRLSYRRTLRRTRHSIRVLS
jgi:NAD-dependent dihydropyrimidine dehydrogenase PreA subunit/nitroreductase